jgi:hypothetical protein
MKFLHVSLLLLLSMSTHLSASSSEAEDCFIPDQGRSLNSSSDGEIFIPPQFRSLNSSSDGEVFIPVQGFDDIPNQNGSSVHSSEGVLDSTTSELMTMTDAESSPDPKDSSDNSYNTSFDSRSRSSSSSARVSFLSRRGSSASPVNVISLPREDCPQPYSDWTLVGKGPEAKAYKRIIRACKNASNTARFKEDIIDFSGCVNYSTSTRANRPSNRTPIYYLIKYSNASRKGGDALDRQGAFDDIGDRIDMADALIKAGTDLTLIIDQDGLGADDCLMHVACERSHPRMVEFLSPHFPDVNAIGFRDFTFLHSAACNHDLAHVLIPYLVGLGTNVNALNSIKCTALDLILDRREMIAESDELIAFLRRNGAKTAEELE